MQRQHVMFLVSDFAPLPSVGRLRTQGFCRHLPDCGWEVTVLTFQPPVGAPTDPALLDEIPASTHVERVGCPQPLEAPVRWAARLVRWLGVTDRHADRRTVAGEAHGPTESPRRPTESRDAELPVSDRWVATTSAMIDRWKRRMTRALMIPDEGITSVPGMTARAVGIIRRRRVDVMVASIPGFAPWLAAVSAGAITGCPVVVDYRDLWRGDVLRAWVGPRRRRLEWALERGALVRSTAVVTASRRKGLFVRNLDPRPECREYRTVYNGFDPDEVPPDAQAFRHAEDQGRVVMLHTGRLYKNRRIDPLIAALGRLRFGNDEVLTRLRLRLVGRLDAPQRARIDRLVRAHRLEDVVRVDDYVTRTRALSLQMGADVVVLVVDTGRTADGVLPGKLFEYLGLRKFVLALCPPGEARELLARYGRASIASPDDPREVEKAIRVALRAAVETDATRHLRGRAERSAPPVSEVVPTRRDAAEALAGVLERTLVRARATKAPRRALETCQDACSVR